MIRPRWRTAAPVALAAAALLASASGAGCVGGDGSASHHPSPQDSKNPRGDLIVYERDDGGPRRLFVVSADGGVPRRVTDAATQDGLPRFTADGQAILFTSNRTSEWQIWRQPLGGGQPVRLRTNQHREWQAAESPDGRRLAFLSNLEGPEQLLVANREGGEARVLVRHGARSIFGNPHWSPEGDRIVFSSNWRDGHQIYLLTVATGESRRITTRGGCEPRFSPDGRRVAYVGRRPQRERSQVLEHDLATGQETVLVSWPALNYDPVYSPDGEHLAFASDISGGWEIYRQRLRDGRAQRITFAGGDARYPDYRPRPR